MQHSLVRDHSQTLVRQPDAKKGVLKIFDPCKGGLEKYYKFSSKNWVYCLWLTRSFHGKKGGLIFFEVWRRTLKKFGNIFFFASGPSYKCLWMVPYPAWKITLYLSVLIMLHLQYSHILFVWTYLTQQRHDWITLQVFPAFFSCSAWKLPCTFLLTSLECCTSLLTFFFCVDFLDSTTTNMNNL